MPGSAIEATESPQTAATVGGLKAVHTRRNSAQSTERSPLGKSGHWAASEGGRGDDRRQPVAPLPSADALPCLLSNNSNEEGEKKGSVLTGGLWKSAFILAQTVGRLVNIYGLERLGFLTLTFRANITDRKEAERRFNSLRTGVLLERYPEFVKVKERQARGAWHFHLIVVLREDIRTGVDFTALEAGDYRTAGKHLRGEWAYWRKTAREYGFGRTELLPIKSTGEGIGRYVGKYLEKHMGNRKPEDKGARLVSYSKGTRAGSTRFSWAGPKGTLWRRKFAQFAGRLGFDDEEAFKEWAYQEYGPKWAYRLAESIAAEVLAVKVVVGGQVVAETEGSKRDGERAAPPTVERFADRVARSTAYGVRHVGRTVLLRGGSDDGECVEVGRGCHRVSLPRVSS